MQDAASSGSASIDHHPAVAWEVGDILPSGYGDYALAALWRATQAVQGAALAVVERDGARRLDHASLADRARRWAHRLRATGLPPGAPVGLCAAADLAIPIGFLAILEAGGAVVPLDPALPADRLRAMAAALGCHRILTTADTAPLFGDAIPLLDLDETPDDAPISDDDRPDHDPDRVAVIYHTSGSTGRPKPVALPHRAISARLRSMVDWFGVAADDVVCAGSTLAFDPFLQQMFFPLLVGGTLWLPDRHALLDPALFWEQAARFGVTHLNFVPSQVEALLRRAPPGGLPGLRRIVMGGERMPPDLPARIAAALGSVAVYNMYGPTEATVDATGWRADPSVSDRDIPIGAPLPGCRVRILNAALERVPVGEVGELCIGGAGLALGYLGMAEATANAFVADPFGAPGDRLYRTGDQARWRPDGQIAFLGRQDEQVKIRGQRIELGEVEAALRAAPGVALATVSKWEDAPGGAALLAHLTATPGGDAPEPEALRRWLAERLPAAAVPARILVLDALPTLPSGKIDRKALPRPALAVSKPDAPPSPRDAASFERRIAAVWAGLLGRPSVDVTANLFEMGAHSLHVPRALIAIEEATGRRLSAVDLFRFPSVAALARHMAGGDVASRPAAARRRALAGEEDHAVAIVGMAFRFPGAADRAAFWDAMMAGTDAVRRRDPASLRADGAPAALVDHPDFIAAHAAIDGTDRFDPVPFGYSHGEAAEIDPQQRLLLQLAWHALEDAACDPEEDGPVGVFAGVGFNSYLVDNLRDRLGVAGGTDRFSAVVGVDKDFAATRIAYKLGLTGPAMTVNSACSTALSVTVAAVDSLRAGRCRVALAGAASLGMFSPFGHIHADGGIASRAGLCRPFDAQADGVVAGAGAAVLVLKRLGDARADGDRVHAVIRGIGIANDGAGKAAFSAPSVDGQAAAIAQALDDAGVEPGQIGFVEGHGTATPLGDPIEVAALNLAYRGTDRRAEAGSALLGSVKGTIGHLDAAAGMAGLIKAALVLERGIVPPTAHFTSPNPRIPFAEGPFRVNGQPEPFPGPADRPRLAGVSGFGMGGTNIHAILSAAPVDGPAEATTQTPTDTAPVLLTLSAATPDALDRLTDALVADLEGDDGHRLADVAGSLARRRPLRHRRVLVAATPAQAARALRAGAPVGEAARGVATALLFPGQGAQQAGMARDLHRAVPAFRDVIDAADRALRGGPAEGLRALLLADPADARATASLSETLLTQPALFVTEYATARALESLGVRANALIGHSVGEYVAACLGGVMGFDDALRLVAARGRLMATAPRGAMLAMSLPEAEVLPLLAQSGADLAAVNAPRQCVAAGTEAQITALAALVTGLGKPSRRLVVSHAFHSALMDPILDAFAEELARTPLAAPTVPILSNVSGDWLRAEEATDPAYWVRHLRGTVRFADGLRRLIDADPTRLLVEAGPGSTLTRLARGAGAGEAQAIAALPLAIHTATQPTEGRDGHAALLDAVGRVWAAGGTIDRKAAAGGSTRRVALPPYPFATIRLWIEPNAVAAAPDHAPPPSPPSSAPPATIDGREAVIAEVWRDVLGVPQVGPGDDFLALGGDSLIAVRIATRLRARLGCEVAASALFRGGTVAGLARLLGGDEQKTEAQEIGAREEGWL
ncbi:polyketide synthase [Azospirillum griseum]|uniref:polyketide synthase n=1 Tax=Azospirillum griseum TaxID=2496639 RepID=UPI0013154607|nr:polyketide synthase [Azospirillum griseum]